MTNLHRIGQPNTYFLLVLRSSSNGQAQAWKALYINVMFSNDIKLMNSLLAALTVLRTKKSEMTYSPQRARYDFPVILYGHYEK